MRGDQILEWLSHCAENVSLVSFEVTGWQYQTEVWSEATDVDVVYAALHRMRSSLRALHLAIKSADTPRHLIDGEALGDAVIRTIRGLKALEFGPGVLVTADGLRRLSSTVNLLGFSLDVSSNGELLLALLSLAARRQLLHRVRLWDQDAGVDYRVLRDVQRILKAVNTEVCEDREDRYVMRQYAEITPW